MASAKLALFARPGVLVRTAAVALVYFLSAWLSLSFVLEPEGIAPLWPPAGIFLAALILSRRSEWPILIGALFSADLAAELLAGTLPLVSAAYAAELSVEAALGAWFLDRFVGRPLSFQSVRQVVGLLACVVLCYGTLALAAAAVASLASGSRFWTSWMWWWATGAVGVVLVTPLVASWIGGERIRLKPLRPRRIVEVVVLVGGLLVVGHFALGPTARSGPFGWLAGFLAAPFLIWAALQFGVRGATSASLMLATVGIRHVLMGEAQQWADVLGSHSSAVLVMQTYLAIVAVSTLLLAAAVQGRKAADRALRESGARLRLAVEGSGVGLWDWDLTTNTVWFSPEWKRQIGYEDHEIGNEFAEWQNRVHPDDLEKTLAVVHGFLERPYPGYAAESRFRHRDGTYRWILAHATALLGPDGKPERMLGIHIDVTGRKQTEAALQEE